MHFGGKMFLPWGCLDCPGFMEDVLGSRWSSPSPCSPGAQLPVLKASSGSHISGSLGWGCPGESSVMELWEASMATSSLSLGSCVQSWALARGAPWMCLCLVTTLADADPVTWLPSFTSDLVISTDLSGNLDSWLTLFCHHWPCYPCCLGTVTACPWPGRCPACHLVTALAARALAAPDHVNLLTWEPALRWEFPSDKCLICFQNGEVRIVFCNSFLCVCV